MRTLGYVATALAFAGLFGALTVTPSDAAPRKQTHARSRAYDGLWSVSIRTQSGPCDASYRYPARIVGGLITQVENDFSYQISGAVVASGAIAVTVSSGGQSATGYGRLHGATGGGHWSAAGGQCIGQWSALRRASN
jgi:hypothetical protein